jgi:hypothetical protein
MSEKASQRTVLPPVDSMRLSILEAKVKTSDGRVVTAEVLDELITKKQKIITFKKNLKLAYKVVATSLGVPIETSRGSFSIAADEQMPSDQYLPIGKIQKTDFKVISIRGYLLGVFGHKKTEKGRDMAFFSIADESGQTLGTVFGKKIKELEDDVGQWNPLLIGNVMLRDVKGTKMFSVGDKTGLVLIEQGDYGLPHISGIKSDPIDELDENSQYVMLNGVIAGVTEDDVFVCDNFHTLSVQEEGAQIPCTKSPCDGAIVASQKAVRTTVVLGDETGEINVGYYPREDPLEGLILGRGIIVRGKYNSSYNILNGYDTFTYDLDSLDEIPIKENEPATESEPPKATEAETPKEDIEYDWKEIDAKATEPAEDDYEALELFWTGVVNSYAPVTPGQFQEFARKKFKQTYKMEKVVKQLIKDGKAKATQNDQGVFSIE